MFVPSPGKEKFDDGAGCVAQSMRELWMRRGGGRIAQGRVCGLGVVLCLIRLKKEIF